MLICAGIRLVSTSEIVSRSDQIDAGCLRGLFGEGAGPLRVGCVMARVAWAAPRRASECFDDSSFASAEGSTKYRRRPQSPQTTARIFADENGPEARLGTSSPPIVDVSIGLSLSKTRSDRQWGQGFMSGSFVSRSPMPTSSAAASARFERSDAAPVASIRWMVRTSRPAMVASSVWDHPSSKRLCAICSGSMLNFMPFQGAATPIVERESSEGYGSATTCARHTADSYTTVGPDPSWWCLLSLRA